MTDLAVKDWSIASAVDALIARLERGRERWPVVRTGPRPEIPWVLRLSVYIRDDFRCKRCAYSNDAGEGLSLDHLKPWSAGGSDDSDNLRVLCLPCNVRRSNWRDGDEGRRLLPTTWWCAECWTTPVSRPTWADGTDLSAAPAVRDQVLLAFCAWCRMTAYTDVAFAHGWTWSPSAAAS